MKKYIRSSLILSVLLIIIFGIIFPSSIIFTGFLVKSDSEGSPVILDGEIRGFENIGQNFTEDKYFNGRPSAVNYNAASSGGSNKSMTNLEYLEVINSRIETFLIHNPDVRRNEIPSELVTASGSGLDPDISPEAAYIQVSRISGIRNISNNDLEKLIQINTEKKVFGVFGNERVNVLKLNIELDKISK